MDHVVTISQPTDRVRILVPETLDAVSVSFERIAMPGGAFAPIDVIDKMPTNQSATNPKAWWARTSQDITGITVHHTGCETPEQAARILLGKGRPTTEYAYFVAKDGAVYQCLPDTLGVWHDHTGHYNKNLSIGLAGYWHKAIPSDAQIEWLAKIVWHLMCKYGIPVEQVQGHNQRAKEAANIGTVCPGWDAAGWKERFFDALDVLMDG